MHLYRAIGLMSGTSMDGIDVALVETDGRSLANPGPASFYPYDDSERTLLRTAIAQAAALDDRAARPGKVGEAERLITTRHAEAVDAFIGEHGLDRAAIGVVGFHGQTVLHRPEKRLTIQIGSGAALAAALSLPVAWDMRAADVAAGGQGAPLVPVWHRALVEAARLPGPVLVINLGGVANVTFVPGDGGDPVAFDTGPANALIDDLMLERTGVPVDKDGAAAASGVVDQAALAVLLAHPYFAMRA
ncbi:MAG: anhydro-N-acetylmuramic acid kinase, partial [Beijerinckiaceae bacterium]|nr:anhydro-N-acetylmuramic acid kinase [Beijerinckiaceae bacterium]